MCYNCVMNKDDTIQFTWKVNNTFVNSPLHAVFNGSVSATISECPYPS